MAEERKEAGDSGKESEKPQEEKQQPSADCEKELAEMKDRLLRLAAEFDNYKKRSAKEMDSAKNLGKAELTRMLLPALDEFELAMCALNGACDEKSKGHAKGIELVFSNIAGTLKNSGLKEIEAKGKYDPYKHEILMTRESKDEEGIILDVVRKGYMFNDLMLRPSAVIVSKGKETLNEDEKQTK